MTCESQRSNPLIRAIAEKDNLKGICGLCQYKRLCGGCRAKAYFGSGDIYGEDPTCMLEQSARNPTEKTE